MTGAEAITARVRHAQQALTQALADEDPDAVLAASGELRLALGALRQEPDTGAAMTVLLEPHRQLATIVAARLHRTDRTLAALGLATGTYGRDGRLAPFRPD